MNEGIGAQPSMNDEFLPTRPSRPAFGETATYAKSYPFPLPGRSYLFRSGVAHPLEDHDFDRTGRVPVLGAGSNQSHEQIARKYAASGDDAEIPVQHARFHGFDAVYAAQLASYGSIPATFCPSPGTVVSTYVLWLDEVQLARMHETEPTYSFDRLDNAHVEICETGEELSCVHVYTAAVGCVNVSGNPVALSEIKADGRIFGHMTQTEMLAFARDRLDPGADLDTFIMGHISDAALRRRRRSLLSADSIRPNFPRTTIAVL